MPRPGVRRFGHGYRAAFYDGGKRIYVLVQRELTIPEIGRLETDLMRMSSGLGSGRSLLIELDVPLSEYFGGVLWFISQWLELPTTVSLPPLAPAGQVALGPAFLDTTHRWLRIEVRRAPGE